MGLNLCDRCVSDCRHERNPNEIVVKCGAFKAPQTNADRIRAMSDEELSQNINRLLEGEISIPFFLLPANVAGVKAVFSRQKVRAPEGQAERTAWRNIRDWIMAQMAIVEAGQVELQEVFFPYLTDGTGRTVCQLYQGGQLALGDGSEG